jgi:hypothetical protein
MRLDRPPLSLNGSSGFTAVFPVSLWGISAKLAQLGIMNERDQPLSAASIASMLR